MSELDDLKQHLTALTIARNEKVRSLGAQIKATNTEYDREATRLARRIAKLEPVLGATPEPAAAPKAKKKAPAKPQRDILSEINRWNEEHGLPKVPSSETA